MYNTKNKKPSKNNKRNLIVVAVALISVFLLLFILEKTSVTNFYSKDTPKQKTIGQDTINYSPPTKEDLEKSEDEKINNIENSSITKNVDEKVLIDEAYYDEAAAELVVKTKLLGLNWSTCELTLSANDQEIVKSAKAIYQPDYSICLGFAIDRSEIPEPGEWTLTLRATTVDGASSSSESTKVTITP